MGCVMVEDVAVMLSGELALTVTTVSYVELGLGVVSGRHQREFLVYREEVGGSTVVVAPPRPWATGEDGWEAEEGEDIAETDVKSRRCGTTRGRRTRRWVADRARNEGERRGCTIPYCALGQHNMGTLLINQISLQ
jgi:hypothetical protein